MALSYDEMQQIFKQMQQIFKQLGFDSFSMRPYDAEMEYLLSAAREDKAIAAYLREHPSVTSKSRIARELNIDRSTVQKYYDEIRSEIREGNVQAS